MVIAIARSSHRLVASACLGSVLLLLGCDPDSGRPETELKGEEREDEILEALNGPLAQAASHVKDQSNWVIGEDDPAPGGDDGAQDDGGASDDGGDSGGGASCSESCGGAATDGSCYCDAECGTNGDCCADYAAQCGGGGDDGGGDDGGGDDGGAAGSCAGSCDGAGSDGVCYCDAECTSNGDCCSDYAAQCGGGDDGGGDDGGAGSCSGYCGGAGSDGACYCDAQCEGNGDCCGDYLDYCAAGEAEVSLGLASPRPTMADDGACWGVITDPVDVERIATAASVGGAVFGGTCVAVLVVPAGAGAVPTAGVSVGAAALACTTSAIGGAAGGAIAELVGQKMGGIAECSGNVMSSVLQVFGWGTGEKVEVPVYGSTTPADPGNCTPDQKDALQQEVTDVCKNAGTRSCSYADACATITAKIDTAAQCINARQKINSQCFDGGDEGHNQQVQQEVNLQNNCYEISTASSC